MKRCKHMKLTLLTYPISATSGKNSPHVLSLIDMMELKCGEVVCLETKGVYKPSKLYPCTVIKTDSETLLLEGKSFITLKRLGTYGWRLWSGELNEELAAATPWVEVDYEDCND